MLTRREEETHSFISDYLLHEGRSPLISEIAEYLGIQSKGTVHRYVQSLIDAGLIERIPGRTRGLRLAQTPAEVLAPTVLPVLGTIAAGRLIEAVPDESEIDLMTMFTGPNRFALKVHGDSMIDAGILPEDWVVIEQSEVAKNGDIVVALVDGFDATLKRLRTNDDGSVTLIPENANYDPITIDAKRVMIQGVVVGQLRVY